MILSLLKELATIYMYIHVHTCTCICICICRCPCRIQVFMIINFFYLFTLFLSLPHSPVVSSISITNGVSNDDNECLGSTSV